ncbi:unnamed protein product [Soboliphyme baturini]|uniref:Uncharacterized protein n=1 Tax=Soboliphyme baturini TaxID=241478 RepID=A0A3P8BQ29_9BILA|nr:unnamed protein product [Soboliphyme baturini]
MDPWIIRSKGTVLLLCLVIKGENLFILHLSVAPLPYCRCLFLASNANLTIMIRTCAMDSGSLTADTEIVRMSHCGHFVLDDIYYSGCVQTCRSDGCNVASRQRFQFIDGLLIAVVLLFVSRAMNS